ncbi:MAG: DNA repair protein RecN [Ornithinimicrobium sp.]
MAGPGAPIGVVDGMLRNLRIRGLGVIDDAEVEFSPGLNVITGETGAGKTMVVTGLGLLLGARADSLLVRHGSTSAVVEGDIDVAMDHPAAMRVREAGGDAGDGVILARTVSAQGRSRVHVGGRAAPVGVLVEVGEHLVAVHGQSDQWRLREADQHRVLLDEFAGAPVDVALARYEESYDQWVDTRRRLEEVRSSSVERAREAQMLRAALEDIARVDPQPGEEDDLRSEEGRLAHADALRQAAAAAHEALVGDEQPEAATPALDLLSQAGAALALVSDHDEALRDLGARLSEVVYLAADVASDLGAYAASIDSDPERLAHVQQRRAALSALLRSYGTSTAEVLAWSARAAQRLDRVDISDEQVADLADEVTRQGQEVVSRGVALRTARSEAAGRLSAGVSAELKRLAMGSAVIEVRVSGRDAPDGGDDPGALHVDGVWQRPRRHGLEDVEIQMAANPGSTPRAITKAASGGELSRVMLALEIVCAQSQVPTYVFDEVDAGVGGAAAVELGARLAQLARTAQVLVVTHLGQVAAFADRHLVVDKNSDGHVTSTAVRAIDGEERVAEIARMIGGDPGSPAALSHARELLSRHTAP